MDRETFARAAGRTLWLDAWASYTEEKGEGFGGAELDDVAPDTPELFVELGEMLHDSHGNVPADFEAWASVDHYGRSGRYTPEERFAHCCALESQGHGVTRDDDPRDGYTRSPQHLRCPVPGMEVVLLYMGDDELLYVAGMEHRGSVVTP